MIKSIIKKSEIISDGNDKVVPWWSFTKTVIACAILKFSEQGKVNLDDCLEGKNFTYRQLLQHTSGLKDYGALPEYHQAVERGDEPWSVRELFDRLNVNELMFEPGQGWSYSNIGYLYLKRELERIGDSDLATVLNSILFTPLDLNDVVLITTPKEFTELALSKADYDPGWCFHGLIAGTTASAARLLHSLSSVEIIKADTLSEMLSPYKLNFDMGNRPCRNPAMGLGLMMDYDDDVESYGHTGQGPGSTIAVYHFTKAEPITIAVFEETTDMAVVENEVANNALLSRS
ncbi:serine hydrolase [Methylophaga sp.]|uniref:serine hydrolase domain-containing protein n=1 Tax=Methylophaga sp. TaxID=2024840 RepID=UPI002717D903|nr:serine hydrolase domain-containing protein [Methylophaga sp.]MDO8827473.1 serine hydrolase domain-containing protein [Methylophaga sp.]